MPFSKKNELVYCPTCENFVVPTRKNFDHIYHEILCFMIFLTLGLGIFIYLILKYRKKKNRCPNCERILELSRVKLEDELNNELSSCH